MPTAPPRYLFARPDAGDPGLEALLRFPPGVTLEDAGHGYWNPHDRPVLPAETMERLRGLGVEVVAAGEWRDVFEALWRADVPFSSVDAFADDYLGVNARLGGGRCVTVREHAMDTWVGHWRLLDNVLKDRLRERGGVRLYGGAAFREGELPGVMRLRVRDIVLSEVCGRAPASMPCLLHGDGCRGYCARDVGEAIQVCLDGRHIGERVAVPRRLLDEARDGGDPCGAARALLGVVGRIFDALPGDAWDWRDGHLSHALASLAALAVAETCEEHAMLTVALRGCGSLREMERRARAASRDASWVVSRALENLRDMG